MLFNIYNILHPNYQRKKSKLGSWKPQIQIGNIWNNNFQLKYNIETVYVDSWMKQYSRRATYFCISALFSHLTDKGTTCKLSHDIKTLLVG